MSDEKSFSIPMWVANYLIPIVLGVGSFGGLKILDQAAYNARLTMLEQQVKEEQGRLASLEMFKQHSSDFEVSVKDFETQSSKDMLSVLDGQRKTNGQLERIERFLLPRHPDPAGRIKHYSDSPSGR